MKDKLIAREVKCINDCLALARVSMAVGNIKYTEILFEDALKSIREVKRLNEDGTVILIGSVMHSRRSNDTINFWLGLVLLVCAFYDSKGLLFE